MIYDKNYLVKLSYEDLLDKLLTEKVDRSCSCGKIQKEHAKNCQEIEKEIERREHNYKR
jgi:hypothetical protein